jgi:hypothetical protein
MFEQATISMKVLVVTLVIAVVAASLLGVAGQVYGYHSTAGFWLAPPNLPGIVAVGLLAKLIRGDSTSLDGFRGLSLVALADWLGYFCLAKIALAVRHRISSRGR